MATNGNGMPYPCSPAPAAQLGAFIITPPLPSLQSLSPLSPLPQQSPPEPSTQPPTPPTSARIATHLISASCGFDDVRKRPWSSDLSSRTSPDNQLHQRLPEISEIDNVHQGRRVPQWNPSSLLQPNRVASLHQPTRRNTTDAGFYTTGEAPGRPSSAPEEQEPDSANGEVDGLGALRFQFTSPHGSTSAGPSSQASTPGAGYQALNGAGSWVERSNQVQPRLEVREPKRRKTEDAQDYSNNRMPVRSGSGMLGGYLREQRELNGMNSSRATTPSSTTVDLTDGKLFSFGFSFTTY